MMQVRGYRILVAPDPVEKVTESGVIIVQDEDRETAATQIGTVLSIGHTCWKSRLEQEPWCEVGDKILFAKYSMRLVKIPEREEKVGVINDDDVLCVVEKAKKET